VSVTLRWRDAGGARHQQTLQLQPGVQDLLVGATAQEVTH